MKFVDNILYLELSEMVECGISEGTLTTAKSKGSKCWVFLKDPADRRKVLVQYEAMKPEYQERVKARFGSPYEAVAREPILAMVENDPKAWEYFFSYKYDGKNLPARTATMYTRAAAWLQMLVDNDCLEATRRIRKEMGLNMPAFYDQVARCIEAEQANGESKTYPETGIHQVHGKFGTSYRKLKIKLERYKAEGFQSIIDPAFGNKNRAKIGKADHGFDPELERTQMAVIRKVASMHNNFDAAQIAALIRPVFEKNNWQPIGRTRVYQILQQNEALLTPGRRGRREYNSTIARQIKRKAPDFPTYYFTMDGWTVELLYQDERGYDNRLVIVVVLDACNKYPVGYAIGERENAELIREALRNAVLHLKDLFGDYYCPYQLQSDRYAIKQLTPFYQAVTEIHTPAAVGNAKAKIIEPYFKYLNKQYCQVQPNWSGFGITSRKENQVNSEFLDMIKTSFPNKAGVTKQIEAMMMRERRAKIEDYLKRWEAMPVENRVRMGYLSEEWLMVFGKPLEKTNQIEKGGIVKTIDGVSYTYDSFDPLFRQNRHIDWLLISDPHDRSKVLAVSKDQKLRFVLEQERAIAMDIRSTTQEDIDHRQRVAKFNKDREAEIIKTYAEDAQIVEEVIRTTPLKLEDEAEAALKLMLTYKGQQKERLQDAKGLKQVQAKEQKRIAAQQQEEADNWQAIQVQYLQSKTDFSQYKD